MDWLLLIFAGMGLTAGIWFVMVKAREKKAMATPIIVNLLQEAPFSVAILNDKGRIVWANRRFAALFGKKTCQGERITSLIPGLGYFKNPGLREGVEIRCVHRKVLYIKTGEMPRDKEKRHLLYCENITELVQSWRKEQEVRPAMACLQFDNLSEVLKTMAEEEKPHLLGALERLLAEVAGNLEGYLQKTGEGRYLLFFSEWGYRQAEKTRFAILDKIRQIDLGNKMPLTVSMGIGLHEENISELGRLAQDSLEIALERGGDQVVVKTPGTTRFYGGKSVGIERGTKVKARVTADALREMMLKASQVMVMGHEMADYDSLGASLGIAKAAADLGKKAWIVVDNQNPATEKLLGVLLKGTIQAKLLKAEEAGRRIMEKTLLVVVDTHKPSLVPNRALLKQAEKVAVIDHHRRGEEFIGQASLVYLESYASSTSELVTELLQYMGDPVEIGKNEAIALLAGITVDTKNFMLKTGVRTFEAASYLRAMGADPTVVQRVLSDDLSTVTKKAEVIREARVLYGKIALGISREISHDAQLMAAKTADAMLNIAGVVASFVIWPYHKGVAVSARSNGEVNVQAIMEEMGGGGHFTVAAAQLEETAEEAEKKLLEILEDKFRPKNDPQADNET